MIFEIIIVSLILIAFDVCCYKGINKSESTMERMYDLTVLIVINVFMFIYYADRFNLPTALNMNINVDTQNWLIIITTCASSIISASIGGLIAFGIARNEIEKNEEQNKENNRIQNMPLLKYEIEPNCKCDSKLDNLIMSNVDTEDTCSYSLKLNIKNIGQNSVKQMIVDFNSSFILKRIRILGNNTQNPLEKEGSIELYKYFGLKKGTCYTIELIIYYEDVLQNWYQQIISINCETEPKEHLPKLNISYTVGEEKVIAKEEIPMNT